MDLTFLSAFLMDRSTQLGIGLTLFVVGIIGCVYFGWRLYRDIKRDRAAKAARGSSDN